jgi:peptidyl-prolyl cis-trans isomerase C
MLCPRPGFRSKHGIKPRSTEVISVTVRLLSITLCIAVTAVIPGTLPLAPQSIAQEQAAAEQGDPDEVVARVDGTPITRTQLDLASDELGPDLAQLPQQTRDGVVLQYVVELTLLAGAAREAGLEDTEQYRRLSRYYELRALRDVFFQQEIRANVTDEAAQKLYDERIGGVEPEQEVKARHILLKTEDDAKAVIQKLSDGADFAELAKNESTGPSAASGGDLGFFSKEQMVTPFAEAAFAMSEGEISEPVKTRFGWHVIKVEEKRDSEPPKFGEIKDRLKSSLVRQQLQQRMSDLREAAKVEILDESLKQTEQEGGNAQ